VSALASFSPSLFVFNGLRFVNGVAVGAMIPPVFSICSEVSPAETRGRNTNHVCWFFLYGSVYISLVAYVIFERVASDNWRLFQIFAAVPSVVSFCLVTVYVKVSEDGVRKEG
jgi:MFS family permease